MSAYGFLAIWCDIPRQHLADYRNWLTREHIADRTFSPGFLSVRLFEALDDETSHFILYATEGPEVLQGPAYQAILDDPSPWTRRLMPLFENFDRAHGVQTLKVGNGIGSHVAIWRIALTDPSVDLQGLSGDLAEFVGRDGVVSIRVDAVDHGTSLRDSEERTMRDGVEGDFEVLLCAETMSEVAALRIEQTLSSEMARLFPALDRFDSSCRRMIYGESSHEGPTARGR